jgi:hypothetical protein
MEKNDGRKSKNERRSKMNIEGAKKELEEKETEE